MNSIWLFLIHAFFVFRCAYGDDVGPDFDPDDGEAYEIKYGNYPYRSYQTINVTSPVVRRIVDSPACYDNRYLFITPRGDSVVAPGPMILDDNGHLVWALEIPSRQPYNFQIQQYQGQPHLTFWLGDDAIGGHGEGHYHLLDSSYQEVARLSPLNGLKADLHELTITPEGTAIFSIYQISAVKAWNKRIWIWDCLFQEIDIATNELIFQWRASEHHSLQETYSSIGSGGRSSHQPWDWYHLNSVQKDELGNYFVSGRYTRTLTYIDGKTGQTIWILGGRRNMFNDLSDGKAIGFAAQHFARMHELTDFPNLMSAEIEACEGAEDRNVRRQKLVSMFDNGASDRIRMREYSRGLLLQIEYPTQSQYVEPEDTQNSQRRRSAPFHGKVLDGHNARLIHDYVHPDNISADSQGSFQVISALDSTEDPTIGVGFGQRPVFTEFTADGRVICDTHFAPKASVEGAHVQSYRAFKLAWVGQPTTPPAVKLNADEDTVYVSWNGATEVVSWQVQHTDEPRSSFRWDLVTTAIRKGFETEIEFDVDKVKRYIRVAAIDKDGNPLGFSESVDLGEQEIPFLIDTDSNTTATTATDPFYIVTTPSMPLKVAMILLCAIAFALTVYGCYHQWFNWRQDRREGYDRLESKPSEGASV